MALTRPYPIDKAWPNAIDLRKAHAGMIPREGLFPDPITVSAVAVAGTGWGVNAAAFTSAFKRQGAPYSLAYGTALGANDGTVTAAWTVGGAPGSGTRVDRLWVRWIDPTQGESLTTPGGETVARAVPIFGITAGTPALPSLPSGVQEIAQVSTPAGAASIAGSTITQVYPFAHLSGGPVIFRNLTEQNAYAPVDGTLAYRLDNDYYLERAGGVWVNRGAAVRARTNTAQATHVTTPYTPQAVTWNLEDFDTNGSTAMHSTSSNTSRLVAPAPGIYRVTAKLNMASTTLAGGIQLGVNGVVDATTRTIVAPEDSAGSYPSVSASFNLDTGDYVEVFSLGEATAMTIDVVECYAEMERIG